MRTVILALSIAAATVVTPAAEQTKLDFTLLNRTGLTIEYIYVSPSSDESWGEDIMGKDVLKHGESIDIEFSRSEKSCMWDLKIKDENDKEVEWENFDLCKIAHITLQYEGGKPTAITK